MSGQGRETRADSAMRARSALARADYALARSGGAAHLGGVVDPVLHGAVTRAEAARVSPQRAAAGATLRCAAAPRVAGKEVCARARARQVPQRRRRAHDLLPAASVRAAVSRNAPHRGLPCSAARRAQRSAARRLRDGSSSRVRRPAAGAHPEASTSVGWASRGSAASGAAVTATPRASAAANGPYGMFCVV